MYGILEGYSSQGERENDTWIYKDRSTLDFQEAQKASTPARKGECIWMDEEKLKSERESVRKEIEIKNHTG